MLLVFGIYFLFDSMINDRPQWSMDDIAPQDYKGPAPEKLINLENEKITVNETKSANPLETAPIVNDTLDKQKKEERPALSKTPTMSKAEQPKQLGSTPEATPFLEHNLLIYFKRNSNELPDESYKILNRVADFMLHNTSAKISIKGYTDASGDYSYNVSVSRFRANTIKTYLVGKGVDSANITADGLGPENPIASNDSAEGRRKNRRVELELSVDE